MFLGEVFFGARSYCRLLICIKFVYVQSTYPYNDNLYNDITLITIFFCRRHRLLWLGHVVREGRNSASYQALEMAINTRDIKRPRGRPHLRWIDNIKNDLKHANIDISDCQKFELALDKKKWLMLVEKCAAFA